MPSDGLGTSEAFNVAGITNDTQLTLNSYPKDANNMSYYIEGPIGLAIDSIKGKQTYPAIVGDGQGGCYIAWTSGATVLCAKDA